MSNKANNSKESILCDAKELMKLYDRVTWHLPKAICIQQLQRTAKEPHRLQAIAGTERQVIARMVAVVGVGRPPEMYHI